MINHFESLKEKIAISSPTHLEKKSNDTLNVDGKDYKVNFDVIKLLGAKGIKYLDGGETTDKKGNKIFYTEIKTLKLSDKDFEKIFVEMYETTIGEDLLKNGVDWEGINLTLEQPKTK